LFKKEDVIYFEHKPEAAKNAQSMGIKTHYYNPKIKDLRALKKFLTDNIRN